MVYILDPENKILWILNMEYLKHRKFKLQETAEDSKAGLPIKNPKTLTQRLTEMLTYQTGGQHYSTGLNCFAIQLKMCK